MWPSPTDNVPNGDIEAAVIEILRNDPIVTSLVPETNISTDLVGREHEYMKWICISREGGPDKFPLDYPRIDIQSFGSRRSEVQKIAEAAHAAVLNSPGYVGHGLKILAAQVEVGLVRSNDKFSSATRYFSSIRLTTRPLAEAEESS